MISIIVNCYNGEQFLRATLESILSQTATDWELIFWDNRSTDGSAALVQSYTDQRIRYFLADHATPLGEARNLAVAQARGEWIAFVDCDDVWYPKKLEWQLVAAGDNGDVGLVYGPVDLLLCSDSDSAKTLHAMLSRLDCPPHGPCDIGPRLLDHNYIIFSTVLVRRAQFARVGGIDPRLVQNEDYDLLLKVAHGSLAVCIENVCASYRIHGSNNSHQRAEIGFEENRLIYRALPDQVLVRRAQRRNASRHAVFLLRGGHLGAGLGMLLRHGSLSWSMARLFKRLNLPDRGRR